MRTRSRGFVVALAVGLVGAVSASPASAETTFGSDLSSEAVNAATCGGCTLGVRAIPGAQVTAPVDGIIVRWRLRSGPLSGAQTVTLRLIRGTGAASTGVGSSAIETIPAGAGLYTFQTRVPVRAGDYLGINCCAATGQFQAPTPGATYDTWDFPLLDGETRAPNTTTNPNEILINADIEPDCDNDGLGDETQDDDIVSCDRTPPDTTITSGPKSKTKKKSATFVFSGTDARVVTGFECSLDGAAFASCTSPHAVKVKKGRHTFSVRAVDANGNRDGTPATYDWKVKRKKRKR